MTTATHRSTTMPRPGSIKPHLYSSDTALTLDAGEAFGAFDHHCHSDGAIQWTYVECIGPRAALLRLRFVTPQMFDVGRSGVKKVTDEFGTRIEVRRYANDVWRLWCCVAGASVDYHSSHRLEEERCAAAASTVDIGPLLERFRRPP